MKVATSMQSTEGMDAEAIAAAQSIKDAGEARKQARLSRRDAQKDQIQLMKRAADKLRDMAGNMVWKGLLNCAAYLASKGAQMSQGSGGAGGATVQALSTALDAVNKLDPIGIHNAYLQADKQVLETEAQVASQRAQEASDQLNEAQRAQSSMTQLMEKVSETRNNVRMTALRG